MMRDSDQDEMSMQLKTTLVAAAPEPAASLARFHNRILQKAQDRSAAPVLIVALGDSVTQGLGGVDHFLHDEVYHQRLKRMLEKQYPLSIFSVINAGVDGSTAQAALERFDRDVVAHQPDLLLLGFGLNDAVLGGPAGVDDFAAGVETLIRRTRDQTDADLILLTSNWMLSHDNDAIPDRYLHVAGKFLEVQHQGVLALYARRLQQIAADHSLALADVYQAWQALADQGADTTAMLANGLNHPDPRGHQLAAEVIFQTIQNHP